MANFQRPGATSNSQVGRDFEVRAQAFFAKRGLNLDRSVSVPIGIDGKSKLHKFDLGSLTDNIIVECKSHTWTETGHVPSAKITTWDQAMYFFHAAPKKFCKILFVLRRYSTKREETLADYYLRLKEHLIPADVGVWEYDERTGKAQQKR